MLGNFEASIGGLDQLTGARFVMDRRRRLVPPFQKTPAVGSAVSLDEAASQQETAPVDLPPSRHDGFEAHPAPLGCQALGVLEHPVSDPALSQTRPDHELLDGADPPL